MEIKRNKGRGMSLKLMDFFSMLHLQSPLTHIDCSKCLYAVIVADIWKTWRSVAMSRGGCAEMNVCFLYHLETFLSLRQKREH